MKKLVLVMLVIAMAMSMVFAGGKKDSSVVLNKDKPLVFFNRQPSDPVTGAIDMTAMNFNA